MFPFYQKIKKIAALSAYRLRLSRNFKAGNLTGDLAILNDLIAKMKWA